MNRKRFFGVQYIMLQHQLISCVYMILLTQVWGNCLNPTLDSYESHRKSTTSKPKKVFFSWSSVTLLLDLGLNIWTFTNKFKSRWRFQPNWKIDKNSQTGIRPQFFGVHKNSKKRFTSPRCEPLRSSDSSEGIPETSPSGSIAKVMPFLQWPLERSNQRQWPKVGAHHGPPRSKSHPGVSLTKSMKYWLFDKDP